MDLVTKAVEAEIQAEGGTYWLESMEGDIQRPKRKNEDTHPLPQIVLDPQTKNTWQKIREYSTSVAELISNAIHQSGTLQPEVLSRIQVASEELFKMTKVVAPDTTFATSVPLEADANSRKKKENSSSDEKKKRRRRAVSNPTNLYCHACGTRDTPEWRRGPDGCKSYAIF